MDNKNHFDTKGFFWWLVFNKPEGKASLQEWLDKYLEHLRNKINGS